MVYIITLPSLTDTIYSLKNNSTLILCMQKHKEKIEQVFLHELRVLKFLYHLGMWDPNKR